MKVIENYKRAIENSDENLLKEVFAPQVPSSPHRDPGWSKPRSASGRSISYHESGGQNRAWNKVHFYS